MLSSKTLQPRQKLLMYEMTSGGKKDGGGVTRKLLRCMGMSEEEYKQLRPQGELRRRQRDFFVDVLPRISINSSSSSRSSNKK